MYAKLLDITRRLSAAQKSADRASDRLVTAIFERDKAHDALHCELVNLGLAAPLDAGDYAPREIEHGVGRGHSVRIMYAPPVPGCVKEAQGA